MTLASSESVDHRTTEINILVVEDEESVQKVVAATLTHAGYEVTLAANGLEALKRVGEALPDLIVSDVTMPQMDGMELLRRLREDRVTKRVPVIFLTAKDAEEDLVDGFNLGVDDFLVKPFRGTELLARVRSKLVRQPVPSDQLERDRRTGLLSEWRFHEELQREVDRGGVAPGCLAYLDLAELPRAGRRAEAEIDKQVAQLILSDAEKLELAGRNEQGRFMLLLPELAADAAQRRLNVIARRIAGHSFTAGGKRVRLTPAIGYTEFGPDMSPDNLRSQAELALSCSAAQLDIHPMRYDASMEMARPGEGAHGEAAGAGLWSKARLPVQIALTILLGLVLPFFFYVGMGKLGVDLTPPLYLALVIMMLVTAILIGWEGLLALRRIDPPEAPGSRYPAASAIIAAYLPNEADVIFETIEAFLGVEYPGPLQIILAYNTPHDMPIEATLKKIAERDSRFVPMRVVDSSSKAQNVNAALAIVNGEFVGIFDADHQPDPENFTRAWRWLSNGYDVVQGHCLVRNGDEAWVARLVAVEFESFYTVSHPGRARLHGFGIFGGSNGYWKTEWLRRTRMRGWMLTEDIDSSMRVVADGGKIVADPWLISRELAPVTLRALWHQRMRWAQGWLQVSYRQLKPNLQSPHLSWRQKLGIAHLLAWREIYPWLSLQIIPILVYHIWWRGQPVNWFIPFFFFTTLVMLSNGPAQVWFTYYLAHPEIKRRKRWFLSYYLLSILFYIEWKNIIARVAHIKEAMGERIWIPTPRDRTREE
jgi:CheY-like chemotaxis protein/cellulose synthase/poly-beta-1,6-N-acetylglucosamine synthase-like glycosyltransferase